VRAGSKLFVVTLLVAIAVSVRKDARAAVPALFPERLSETGLYAGTGTTTIDSRNLPFSPQYPLWSDGAAKARWIFLPEGTTIDVSRLDAWQYPVGTKLWKEFAFGGRKVETRMIWRSAKDTWSFATYVWDEEQSDAVLVPEEGIRDHVEIASGKRHSIPSVADCHTCHEAGLTPVLGFNALQLSDDRDPMAPHAEALRPEMATLRSLVESRRLDPARRDLVEQPPSIRGRTPLERAALGYLSTNCGTCHNASGPLARLGLVLAHEPTRPHGEPEPAIATALGAVSRFLLPGAVDGESRRIAPGAPERSTVVYRMRSRRPSSQMPPLGTVQRDEEAVRLIERWIAEIEKPALP
jgi:hypothetical protein